MENLQRNFKIKIDKFFEKYMIFSLSLYLYLVFISSLLNISLNNINIIFTTIIFIKIVVVNKINKKTIILVLILLVQTLLNFFININKIDINFFFADSKYIYVFILFLITGDYYLNYKNIIKIKNLIFMYNSILILFISGIYIFIFNSNRIFFLEKAALISDILPSSFAFYKDRIFSANFTIGYILVSLINILEAVKKDSEKKKCIIQNIIILFYSIYFSALGNLIGVLSFFLILIIKKFSEKDQKILLLFVSGFGIIFVIYILEKILQDDSIGVRLYQAKYLWKESLNHIVFGKGYGGYVFINGKIDKFKPYLYELDILSLLMKLGVVGCIIYYIPLFYLLTLAKLYLKKIGNFMIFSITLLLLLSSNGGFLSSTFYAYIFVIIYYYLKSELNEGEEDENKYNSSNI